MVMMWPLAVSACSNQIERSGGTLAVDARIPAMSVRGRHVDVLCAFRALDE